MVNFIESVHHFKPHVFLLENLPKLLEVIPENQWENEIFPDYNLVFTTIQSRNGVIPKYQGTD